MKWSLGESLLYSSPLIFDVNIMCEYNVCMVILSYTRLSFFMNYQGQEDFNVYLLH